MEHSPDNPESPSCSDPRKVELSDKKAREFQKLLKEEGGLEVSLDEGRAMTVRMMRLQQRQTGVGSITPGGYWPLRDIPESDIVPC